LELIEELKRYRLLRWLLQPNSAFNWL